jgi:salicylate hydroxylase
MGLHKKGVPFTIYEAESEYSVVGYVHVRNMIKGPFLTARSAGIGFGPNGDLALDMLEEGFGAEYEKVCVGNKPADAQNIYFEAMLLQEGLGAHCLSLSSRLGRGPLY